MLKIGLKKITNIVILAAAKVGGIFANKNNPSDFILDNLKIQTNLIEISNSYKVEKFLFLEVAVFIQNLLPNPSMKKSY